MTDIIIARLRERAMSAAIGERTTLSMAANLLEQQKKELVLMMAEMADKQRAFSYLVEKIEVLQKERDTLLKQLEIADVYCQFCE